MGRHGFTASGRQRWRCWSCGRTGVRQRRDVQHRRWSLGFIRWLTESERLAVRARRSGVSVDTLQRRYRSSLAVMPEPRPVCLEPHAILVLDGTTVVRRQSVALIAMTPHRVVSWRLAVRECFVEWSELLETINGTPLVAVMDGQKGLEKAVQQRWPGVRVQRCIIHVHRQAMAWLTQHPKTMAGAELRQIVRRLLMVGTKSDARRWQKDLDRWCHRHDAFLRERTPHPTEPRRWWYTHRKLRAVRSLLVNSAPDLFIFLDVPRCPRTSNHLEGGINARLKDLGRCHRGISNNKKHALVAWYLRSRQE